MFHRLSAVRPVEPRTVRLGAGEAFDFEGVLLVQTRGEAGGLSTPVQVGTFERRAIRAGKRPLALLVTPEPQPYPEIICE